MSEAGYQPLEVGVGCSNGATGGDPNWNQILANGTYPNISFAVNAHTVWPKVATVAVSEAIYGGVKAGTYDSGERHIPGCWKWVEIRNKAKPDLKVYAVIVDFCPKHGCLWPDDQLAKNVDIYGEYTWIALGGGSTQSTLELEIRWPLSISSNGGNENETLDSLNKIFSMHCSWVTKSFENGLCGRAIKEQLNSSHSKTIMSAKNSRTPAKISKSDISKPLSATHVASFRKTLNDMSPTREIQHNELQTMLTPDQSAAAITSFGSGRFDTSASIAGSPLDPRMQNREPQKLTMQQFQNFIQAVGGFRRQLVAMGLAAEMFVRSLEEMSDFVPAADIKKPHI
ncbi:hypothetical protein HK096_008312, partial [Nowakowskiella sp. JEL0078]